MSFQAIAVRQARAFALSGQTGTVALTFDSAVLAGSALVVIGTSVRSDTGQTTLLSSASGGATWGSATNAQGSGSYTPNAFAAVGVNASAGSPTVTLTLNQAASNRVSCTLLEIEKVPTSAVVDKTVTGTNTADATVSTAATGLLTQTDNLLILCGGGYIGIPSNPSGWVSHQTQQNGTFIGCQVSSLKVTSTASVVGSVTGDTAGLGKSAVMLALKAAAVVGGPYYEFLLRSDTFTSADTGLEAFVWRNGDPDVVVAEKYTGLAGNATAGKLLISSGLPVGVTTSDTIRGLVRVSGGTGDTSGIITGTVKE